MTTGAAAFSAAVLFLVPEVFPGEGAGAILSKSCKFLSRKWIASPVVQCYNEGRNIS